jgi:hypothetical protein
LAANKTSGLFRDYLNQAGKLSRTFTMLLDALNRHRGKGSQKITVERVHTGGQAVVGIVEAPGGGVQPSRIEASRAAMSSGLASMRSVKKSGSSTARARSSSRSVWLASSSCLSAMRGSRVR